MFKIVGKRCNTSGNFGTGMLDQVRLFRDSSISYSASIFVANWLKVKSLKMNLQQWSLAVFSSPEHKVLMVNYCDQSLSVVHRLCVVNFLL